MRRLIPLLVLALLLAPGALAGHTDGAQSAQVVGPVRIGYRFEGGDGSHTFANGTNVTVRFFLEPLDNGTYRVAIARLGETANVTGTATPGADPLANSVTTTFVAHGPAGDTVIALFAAEVHRLDNGTAAYIDRGNLEVSFAIIAPTPPPVTGFPAWAWYVVGALVLLIALVVVQKARKRQVRVAPRSRTLQELQVEDKAEKTSARRAAEVEAARQEVEAREAERLAQRENSIVDAKRQDILRSIELMKQRRERGELTEFQFQKLKEKKEAQLAELDRQGGPSN